MTRRQTISEHLGPRPHMIHMDAMQESYGECKPYEVAEGVAIINICGVLSNDPSCGDTSYAAIQSGLRQARADSAVRSILLWCDSPGGETDGAFETAALVAQINKDRPCFAVADPSCYSAAYLIASQASEIWCAPTSGGVGSIGVYAVHVDVSEALKQAGVKMTLISAGDGKTDGNQFEPLSATAQADIQSDVDRLYGEFVAAVSAGRGLRESAVVKLGARLYQGSEAAIGAGLANRAGSLEDAWVSAAEMPEKKMPMPTMPMMGANVASATESKKEAIMPAEQVKAEATETAAAPAMVAQAAAANLQGLSTLGDGVYADGPAVAELCCIAGKPALAAKFISAKFTRSQVSAELLKQRAAESGPDIASHILPDASTNAEANDKSFVKYTEARIAASKQGGK